jgi:hypothetical protein
MSTIKQDDCLATGERTKTEGNVAVTLQGIIGEVSKPSIISIMMNHRTIRKIFLQSGPWQPDNSFTVRLPSLTDK